MIPSELIINANPVETRVALMEGGAIVELFVERPGEKGASVIGNIYKGRVSRVLPGMQAAFVDIGLERAAFLYVSDILEELENFGTDDEDVEVVKRERDKEKERIQDLLKEGQEILVQIAKDPISTKGARITSYVSIPGRYVVLMPTVNHVGVSRRIDDPQERGRLKSIVNRTRPDGFGFIVRTAAGGRSDEEIKADVEYLVQTWKTIQSRFEKLRAPVAVYSEMDLSLRAVRDLFGPDVARVVIDDEAEYNKVKSFADALLPHRKDDIIRYEGKEPIFEKYQCEAAIQEALGVKVWLKSGGSLVIEQAEALTAIDVNTGKFVGKRDLEETILKTNLEAAKEIVYQLRLRNMGGLIILDFIDMVKAANRDKVYGALRDALRRDKAKSNILKISELGLVEMTRKRTRESLMRVLADACPYCEGKGYIKSEKTICAEIYRALAKELPTLRDRKVVINAHPAIAERLYDEEREGIEVLEQRYKKRIIVKKKDLHREQFEIENLL
jgi:ribonuclease G